MVVSTPTPSAHWRNKADKGGIDRFNYWTFSAFNPHAPYLRLRRMRAKRGRNGYPQLDSEGKIVGKTFEVKGAQAAPLLILDADANQLLFDRNPDYATTAAHQHLSERFRPAIEIGDAESLRVLTDGDVPLGKKEIPFTRPHTDLPTVQLLAREGRIDDARFEAACQYAACDPMALRAPWFAQYLERMAAVDRDKANKLFKAWMHKGNGASVLRETHAFILRDLRLYELITEAVAGGVELKAAVLDAAEKVGGFSTSSAQSEPYAIRKRYADLQQAEGITSTRDFLFVLRSIAERFGASIR